MKKLLLVLSFFSSSLFFSGCSREIEYTVNITYENGVSEIKSVMLPENSILYLTEKSCGRRYLWARTPAPFGGEQPVVMSAVTSFKYYFVTIKNGDGKKEKKSNENSNPKI